MLVLPKPLSMEFLKPGSVDLFDSLVECWELLASKSHQAVVSAAKEALKIWKNTEGEDLYTRKEQAYEKFHQSVVPHGFRAFTTEAYAAFGRTEATAAAAAAEKTDDAADERDGDALGDSADANLPDVEAGAGESPAVQQQNKKATAVRASKRLKTGVFVEGQ